MLALNLPMSVYENSITLYIADSQITNGKFVMPHKACFTSLNVSQGHLGTILEGMNAFLVFRKTLLISLDRLHTSPYKLI